jgi:hypothetical protein
VPNTNSECIARSLWQRTPNIDPVPVSTTLGGSSLEAKVSKRHWWRIFDIDGGLGEDLVGILCITAAIAVAILSFIDVYQSYRGREEHFRGIRVSAISFGLIRGTVWHWAYWIAHDGSIVGDYIVGAILMTLYGALVGLLFGVIVYMLILRPSLAALSAFDKVREHLHERIGKRRTRGVMSSPHP